MQVLDTYQEYPEFIPNVSHSEILEQNDSDAVIKYTSSLPVGQIKKYRLKIVVTEYDKETSMLEWWMEKWPEDNEV